MENILNELIDRYQQNMIEDLKSLVEIPSVLDTATVKENAPFGADVRRVLDEVIAIAEKLGFTVRDYDGYAASVRLGTEGKEVGVLCHADVVPAEGQWKTDPFEAVVKEGKIYGRGTIDDKGPLVGVLYAMKAIKESGLPMNGHINHIIGCNEESGHQCIKYYLQKEKGPDLGFSPDGIFPVIHGEKGIIRYSVNVAVGQDEKAGLRIEKMLGGSVVNAVPDSAKAWLAGDESVLDEVEKMFEEYDASNGKKSIREDGSHLLIEFDGISAHAMQPWLGENAILSVLQFLQNLPQLSAGMTCFLQSLWKLYGDGWQGERMGIACEDQLSGKLSQNLGVLEFENGQAEVKVDVRCPIHVDMKMIWKTILMNCRKYHLNPVYWQMRDSLYIPKEAPLVEKLLKVYNEMTDSSAEAVTIGGGTYCRDVENFVSFGPVFPYEQELAHEANENIGVKEFILSAKLYAQALYALLK